MHSLPLQSFAFVVELQVIRFGHFGMMRMVVAVVAVVDLDGLVTNLKIMNNKMNDWENTKFV